MSAPTPPSGITPEQAGALAELVTELRKLGGTVADLEMLANKAMDTGIWRLGEDDAVVTDDEMSVTEMVNLMDRLRRDMLRMVLVPLGKTLLPGMMGIDKPE